MHTKYNLSIILSVIRAISQMTLTVERGKSQHESEGEGVLPSSTDPAILSAHETFNATHMDKVQDGD